MIILKKFHFLDIKKNQLRQSYLHICFKLFWTKIHHFLVVNKDWNLTI